MNSLPDDPRDRFAVRARRETLEARPSAGRDDGPRQVLRTFGFAGLQARRCDDGAAFIDVSASASHGTTAGSPQRLRALATIPAGTRIGPAAQVGAITGLVIAVLVAEGLRGSPRRGLTGWQDPAVSAAGSDAPWRSASDVPRGRAQRTT
jgi:hypothetical protein